MRGGGRALGKSYCDVEHSPDGSLVAAALCGEPVVEWIQVSDGSVVKRYGELPGAVRTLAFSDDGTRLFIGYHNPQLPYVNGIQIRDASTRGLHLWSTATGEYLWFEPFGGRPFTSRVEDRIVFQQSGMFSVARSGPFWVSEFEGDDEEP